MNKGDTNDSGTSYSESSRNKTGRAPSLWEQLGKGAGKGLKAAKEMGNRLAAEGKPPTTERQQAVDRLDERYRELGELIAGRLSGSDGATVTAADPEVERLLEEIRRDRESLKLLDEKKSEETTSDEG
jgi:hypothetical protein